MRKACPCNLSTPTITDICKIPVICNKAKYLLDAVETPLLPLHCHIMGMIGLNYVKTRDDTASKNNPRKSTSERLVGQEKS